MWVFALWDLNSIQLEEPHLGSPLSDAIIQFYNHLCSQQQINSGKVQASCIFTSCLRSIATGAAFIHVQIRRKNERTETTGLQKTNGSRMSFLIVQLCPESLIQITRPRGCGAHVACQCIYFSIYLWILKISRGASHKTRWWGETYWKLLSYIDSSLQIHDNHTEMAS